MKLDDFASAENILLTLCRLRIKLAQKKNAKHLIHLHSNDPKHNYHISHPSKTEVLICSFFPPRKKWKKPCAKKRFKDGASLNTAEKNLKSLLMTIDHYKNNYPNEPCILNLNNFILDIQKAIKSDTYKFRPPLIIPKLKEDKQSEIEVNICRPIASFSLKDKIIIGIANKYLTWLVDEHFCDESFAFRARREINGIQKSPTHHDPVSEILEYRRQHTNGTLWVSECDMKKFFDTVNHTIIKKAFGQVFNSKKLKGYSKDDLLDAKRILYNYLDSYTFNRNVLPLNKDIKYFKKNKIKNGKFGWVEDELISNGYYKKLNSAKIGIPQGGSLSGLIANVVLHNVDKRVLKHQDGSLLYVRYCDDMLILHPIRSLCEIAFDDYLLGLKFNKLVPHSPKEPPFENHLNFWKGKSKKCYEWNNKLGCGSPWIGFVGYEIHFDGHVRVRKSSLLKEMKKQFKVVGELKRILNDPLRRSSPRTIYESIANRLIGMSVGRVSLWNYKSVKNEMCWINGYKLLTNNKYTQIQLRRLDSSRSKLLRRLNTKVEIIEKLEPTATDQNKASKQVFYYGNPFSYHYHILTKPKNLVNTKVEIIS